MSGAGGHEGVSSLPPRDPRDQGPATGLRSTAGCHTAAPPLSETGGGPWAEAWLLGALTRSSLHSPLFHQNPTPDGPVGGATLLVGGGGSLGLMAVSDGGR